MNLQIDENNIDESFERIAEDLLNNFLIKINNIEYRITEIEFYFKGDKHDDEYAHCDVLQKEQGKWYFHGSGLDLTIGQNNYCGGILIRAINRVTPIKGKESYTYGPLNVIKELFSNISNSQYSNIMFGLLKDKSMLFKDDKIFKGPRVGLNKNKNEAFYNKDYRFLVMPKKKHAEKTRIYNSLINIQKLPEEEAKQIWA